MSSQPATAPERRQRPLTVVSLLRESFARVSELYHFFPPHRGFFWGLVAFTVLLALWDGIIFSALLPVLDSIMGAAEGARSEGGGFLGLVTRIFDAVPASARIHVGVVAVAGLSVGRAVLMVLRETLVTRFMVKVVTRQRQVMFSNLMKTRFSEMDQKESGDLLQSLVAEIKSISNGANRLLGLFQAMTLAAVIIALMVMLSWSMTLLILGAGAIALSITVYSSRKIRRVSAQAVTERSRMMVRAHESLAGIRKIRAFNLSKRAVDDFTRYAADSEWSLRRSQILARWLGPVTELTGIITLAAVISLSAVFNVFADGKSEASELLLFLLLVTRIVPTLSAMNGNYAGLSAILPSLAKVRRILEPDPSTFERGGRRRRVPLLSRTLSFEGVSLSYPGGVNALTDVSLRVDRGQRVAIVGDSGAGKSSLVALIPRFYDAQQGRIALDGVDLREFDLAHLRDRIGIVSQEVFLFNTTVIDNILMGRPGASRAEVEDAARRAYAHEFIMELPDGYDTVVGERGVTLSGGQKQRITIAQVFLRDPEILILDEATNALDSESEAFVQRSFDELMKGRSTFVIAHRLNTIRNADLVIVLRDGRIVERGDWDSLVRAGGEFARMVELQSLGNNGATAGESQAAGGRLRS